MSEIQSTSLKCPVCQSDLKEGTWPPPAAGSVLVFNGIFFLLVFAWYASGAFVEHPRAANDFSAGAFLKPTEFDNAIVNAFRLYLPAIVGLLCLFLGWRSLKDNPVFAKEGAHLCTKCEHSQAIPKKQ